jgi:nucleoside-diphosphate-sugar epimerase
MKIAISGGSGKIGQYVVRELLGAGHGVTVVDKVPPPAADHVRWVRADLEDYGEVVSALKGVDAVAHLAAYTMPYRDVPDHVLFRGNTMATYHVHEAAYCLGIRRVVSTSSGAVLGWAYGEREIKPKYLPVDEDHPLMPQDPYGLSKLCGEEIARSYTLKADMETIALRPAWVIFPEIVERVRRQGGRPPTKFDVYTYIDVRDLAAAYRQAVEVPGIRHERLYIVADDSTTTEPLCDVLPRLMPGIGDMAKSLTGNRAGISNEKAKKLLKWQPRYSWRTAN